MRYTGSCEEYIRNSKNQNPEDLIYIKMEELQDIEAKIAEIRKQNTLLLP